MSESFDLAVVGSGAAGLAAAVNAARAGCATLLLDSRVAAGGTGGFSGLTTLCGLFDSDEGAWLNDGFAREFAENARETPRHCAWEKSGCCRIARKNFASWRRPCWIQHPTCKRAGTHRW